MDIIIIIIIIITVLLGYIALFSLPCRLGGVVVSVLATGPRGCGFKTQPRRWIFNSDKNPQHTFLSDGK
jgi:hypothetical protein